MGDQRGYIIDVTRKCTTLIFRISGLEGSEFKTTLLCMRVRHREIYGSMEEMMREEYGT